MKEGVASGVLVHDAENIKIPGMTIATRNIKLPAAGNALNFKVLFIFGYY